MEAAALERLACIETRSQELKKMLKTRAVQKSLEDLESSSSHHGNINSQSANESPRCVSGNGVSLEPENKKKPDYIEGARPGLMDSYPERNFQRFCTDNVRLIRPSDFVTVGHIKPNIHLGKSKNSLFLKLFSKGEVIMKNAGNLCVSKRQKLYTNNSSF